MNQKLKTPSIDEVIALPAPNDARISPDGEWVAYTLTRPDWKLNEFVSQIWLVSTRGGEPRQLTFARQSSRSPRWSPDGRWLGFLSKREGDEHSQLYRISPQGGEAERLTEHDTDISEFDWSPDGQAAAFIAPDAQAVSQKEREEAYGEYHVEDEDHVRAHLWMLRLADQKTTRLTYGSAFHVVGFDWNPMNPLIALDTWPSPDQGDFDRGQIYLLDLDSFGLTLISDEGCGVPRWSPDGAQLAFLHMGTPTYMANNTLRVVRFEGLPSPHELVTGSQPDQTIRAANIREPSAFEAPAPAQFTVPMKFDEEMWLEDWGLDGLYCTAIQRTSAHLFRVDPGTGAVTGLTPLDQTGWASFGATYSKNFSRAALIAYDIDHYGEVTVLALNESTGEAAGTLRRLTDHTALVQDWRLGQSEVIRWKSEDGTEIEGVVTRPPDFDPLKKYPLLVVIHGGPTGSSMPARLLSAYPRRIYPMVQWLERGAIILEPNYRGSAGYGEAFRMLNVRNLGLGDCMDVVSGVDEMIRRGWVDADRVGVMGWSQGGYISAFCTTFASDRFRAASVGAGISNWITYYVNTDIHPFTRQYLQANPWEDAEVYRSTSPMTYIQRAHTPTLIQHGTADKRVPPPNAFELYQGLRDMGVEVRLVTYPGMPHGPGKPRTCRQIMQENFNWFNRWIWDEPAKLEAADLLYVAIAGIEPVTTAGELPVYIRDVQREARRDGAEFTLFSPRDGLVRVPEIALLTPDGLAAEAIPALARQIAAQLKAEKIRNVTVFIPEDRQDAVTLTSLSCLHLAVGLAGEVKLEQRTLKV